MPSLYDDESVNILHLSHVSVSYHNQVVTAIGILLIAHDEKQNADNVDPFQIHAIRVLFLIWQKQTNAPTVPARLSVYFFSFR